VAVLYGLKDTIVVICILLQFNLQTNHPTQLVEKNDVRAVTGNKRKLNLMCGNSLFAKLAWMRGYVFFKDTVIVGFSAALERALGGWQFPMGRDRLGCGRAKKTGEQRVKLCLVQLLEPGMFIAEASEGITRFVAKCIVDLIESYKTVGVMPRCLCLPSPPN